MTEQILVNGEPASKLTVLDRGFHYGDGLYETLQVLHRLPVFLQPHLNRLNRGCKRLNMPLPDATELAEEIRQLASDMDHGVVKVVYTRGVSPRGFAFDTGIQPTRVVQSFDYDRTTHAGEGATMRLCAVRLAQQPLLAGLKHLNQLERVMARNEWADTSIREGLMCDTDGNVIEGTMSNLFVVKEGQLLTPDLSQCGIQGVIRDQILKHSADIECAVDVVALTVDDVRNADEIFMTNSLLPVLPVVGFEDHTYSIGPLTRRIMAWLEKQIELDIQVNN